MVRLSDPGIVRQIKEMPPFQLFAKSPLLKRCYPLMLVGNAAEGLPLRLDPVLGLVIERKKKGGVADNATLLS